MHARNHSFANIAFLITLEFYTCLIQTLCVIEITQQIQFLPKETVLIHE